MVDSGFDVVIDGPRIESQMDRVYSTMTDGVWRTLEEIALEHIAQFGVIDTEAAISARLRDLRKSRFGMTVEKRRRGSGRSALWEYRVAI